MTSRVAAVLVMAAACVLPSGACGVKVTGPMQQEVVVDAAVVDVRPSDSSDSSGSSIPDAAIDAPAPPPCDGSNQVETGSGACFTLVGEPLTWAAAGSACAANGQHLAIIRNPTDNDDVKALVGASGVAFLGGTDQQQVETWLWVDGTEFWVGSDAASGGAAFGSAFAAFASSEPNQGGGKFLEECLTMNGPSGAWDDRPCGPESGAGGSGQDAVEYEYVCEFP